MLIIRKNFSIFIKICHFLPERKKVNKAEKLICNIEDKEKYVNAYKSFKTSLKSWINIKKKYIE